MQSLLQSKIYMFICLYWKDCLSPNFFTVPMYTFIEVPTTDYPVARNEWRCVTSPTAPHKIFISIVIGRGFCSTARIYEPYVRVSKMHPCIRTVVTHYPYIRVVQPKSIANNVFFCTGRIHTGRIYGWPVRTTRAYGPYIRMYGPYARVSKIHRYTGTRYTLPA